MRNAEMARKAFRYGDGVVGSVSLMGDGTRLYDAPYYTGNHFAPPHTESKSARMLGIESTMPTLAQLDAENNKKSIWRKLYEFFRCS